MDTQHGKGDSMTILGIDPGKKGGLAFYSPKNDAFITYAMPLLDDGKVDICKIQEWIILHRVSMAFIEMQQTRGLQGGNMTIGSNYGRLTAVLDLCGIEYKEIEPRQWHKATGLNSNKRATIAWCENQGYEIPWTSYKKNGERRATATKHDGIADAIGIVFGGMAIARRIKDLTEDGTNGI